MFSSYSQSKRLVYVPILTIQLLLIRSVSSLNLTNDYLNHKCLVSEGKYKHGSKYEENLNYLTKSVSTYELPDGSIRVSRGEAPNSITIILQCRGDSYESKCRSCYATSLDGARLWLEANGSKRKNKNMLLYAEGEKTLGKKKLYAMVQCAQDILQCKDCLEWSIRELAKCCDGKQGARVLGSDCNLRYELYPFLRS